MGIRVGIDLGTTFSAVAYVNPVTGKAEIIKNKNGGSVTPSVLCFQEDGEILYGEDAKLEQSFGNPNTASFFKRYIGNDAYELEFFGKTYNPVDLSAILLKKLVEDAQNQIGENIDSAVITVPAYFAHFERDATIRAAKKAGINVISIISEPTSAAFAYGMNEKNEKQTIMIYDLGGGTFDVTVASIDNNSIKVLGCDGNHELGGKDWDDLLARFLAMQFYEKYDVEITDSQENINALLVQAETVKKKLTNINVVTERMNYNGIKGEISVSIDKFNEITSSLLNITTDISNRLLDSINLGWKDIDGVILVGGSTRMRMISDFVKKMSGKEALNGINVDEAVALGAAIRANIDVENGTSLTSIAGKETTSSVLPPSISGAKRMVDATAHALGMIAETSDREKYINSVIIPKNTAIPVKIARVYKLKTGANNSNELEVYVLQGTNERPLDNTVIHKYVIKDITHTSSGVAEIEISYEYSEYCIVVVSAKQKETGQCLTVVAESVPADMSWTYGCPKDFDPPLPELEVVLAVDVSGSMSGEPMKQAKNAMKSFVDQMDSDYTKISIVSFSDRAEENLSLTNDFKRTSRAIDDLTVCSTGVGNDYNPFEITSSILMGKTISSTFYSATSKNTPKKEDFFSKLSKKLTVDNTNQKSSVEIIEKANEASLAGKKSKNHKKREVKKFLIVLTDGMWCNEETAIRKANELRKQGVDIIALGFGSADYSFLKKIASSDDYASLTDLANLSTSFSKIAQEINR